MELEKIVFVGPKKVRKQLKRAVGKLPDNSIKIEFFNGMAEDRNIKIDYGLICRIVRGADGKHYCHLSGDKNCKIHIIKIPKDSKYFGKIISESNKKHGRVEFEYSGNYYAICYEGGIFS
ncbi:MAG TPA: hypothetical protein VJH65_02905 [Candidatus Nanoarchaeia archaeon]|nr:hypothetical protein [Candidatus Nanoarchaeia archaeon]